MNHGEVAVYGVLTVLGATAATAAPGYGILVEGDRVGPGLLPLAAGVLVALLFGVELVKAVRRDRSARETATGGGDDVDIFGRTGAQRVRMLWAVFGLLLATVLLVQVIGFLVAFGLFAIVVSTAVERRPLAHSALIGLLAVAVVYAVFVEFLSVPLPSGILGLG